MLLINKSEFRDRVGVDLEEEIRYKTVERSLYIE